ncbi:hypothetical protein RRG08_013446, partial [Elysia crispata]
MRSTSSTRILHLNILYPNPSSQHPLPESFISHIHSYPNPPHPLISTSSTRILHPTSPILPLPESFISTSSTRILHLNIFYPNPSSQHPHLRILHLNILYPNPSSTNTNP